MGMEYVRGDTFVHKLTPYTKIIFALWIMLTAFLLWDISSMLTYVAIAMTLWALARIPDIWKRFKTVFLVVAGTASIYLVAQGFFFMHNQTPLFVLFELSLWDRVYGTFYLEGFLYGLAMAMKIFLVVVEVPVLTLTTSVPDLIVAMDKMRVPYKFNFALATAFRFSPLILTSFGVIQEAQRLRAHNIEKMGFIQKISKAYVPIITPLFISLLRRSDELEIAIESRGFGAPVERTFVNEVNVTWRDVFMIMFMIGFTILTVYQIYIVGNGSIYPVELMPWWLKPMR